MIFIADLLWNSYQDVTFDEKFVVIRDTNRL